VRHVVLLATVVAVVACSPTPTGRTVRVAAAADLTRAFEELGKAFEAKTRIRPLITFDSSGSLAQRIDQGAPFFLFASAGKQFVDEVVAHGGCDASSVRSYARGHIVVWVANGTEPPKSLADLADPRFKRIAIANPETAPYGKAAKQALQRAGVWDQLAGRVKYGDNIQATMQFAKTGAVDAAIVARSLAVVTDGGASLAIDEALHDPIEQQLVLCGSGEEADTARQLAAYIASPEGHEVMTRYGFVLPP
jgi:molybdate transport system substrate-binding protein